MAKTALALISDQALLKTAITKHGKDRAKLDHTTHVLAVSAISVFKEHGNVFYINHLYANMGKGARHAALTAWLLEFGGVQANTGEGKDVTPFVKDKDKTVNIEGGIAAPWYDFKPSPKPDEVFDVLKLTLALIKKAKGAQSKAGSTVTHAAMIEKLESLAEEFETAEEVSGQTEPDPS